MRGCHDFLRHFVERYELLLLFRVCLGCPQQRECDLVSGKLLVCEFEIVEFHDLKRFPVLVE